MSSPTIGPYQLVCLRTLGQEPAVSPYLRFVITSQTYLSSLEVADDYGSPFYNIFTQVSITEVSERRARKLLEGAGITQSKQVSFCLEIAERRLPLDLLIIAYHLQRQPPVDAEGYANIQNTYRSLVAAFRQHQQSVNQEASLDTMGTTGK